MTSASAPDRAAAEPHANDDAILFYVTSVSDVIAAIGVVSGSHPKPKSEKNVALNKRTHGPGLS